MKPVIIIGGGWAGLAAACTLAEARIPVQLLEAAPQLGGRARTVRLADYDVDNGQHLLIGAYSETLRLLHTIGLAEEQILVREALQLDVRRKPAALHLRAPRLPAPLHLLWALWQGLQGHERRAALGFCLNAWRNNFQQQPDISVAELLQKQPPSLLDALWQPLCLATLNTPVQQASAQVFLQVLRDAFNRQRRDSDLLHPRTTLSQVLPQPAQDYVVRQGGQIHRRCRALALDFSNNAPAVSTNHGTIAASQIILATAPWHAAKLLADHPQLHDLRQQIKSLGSAPITTVYLAYPTHISLGQSMLGFSGGLVQWLIDRGILCNQPGLLAAVISGPGNHNNIPAEKLKAQVAAEIAEQFPHWPEPLWPYRIREQRATFFCDVDSNKRRPANVTAQTKLWLAGDYTDTAYPATLEGAVRSGVYCAQQIIQTSRR